MEGGTACRQVGVDGSKDAIAQVVRFEQSAENQERGGQARLPRPDQCGQILGETDYRRARLQGLRRPGHTIAGGNTRATCAPIQWAVVRVRLWDRIAR